MCIQAEGTRDGDTKKYVKLNISFWLQKKLIPSKWRSPSHKQNPFRVEIFGGGLKAEPLYFQLQEFNIPRPPNCMMCATSCGKTHTFYTLRPALKRKFCTTHYCTL
jgi:hypothetical protein